MARQNSANQQFTNNADGYSLAGGTTARTMTVVGADVTITGSGTATFTYPTTSDTLAGLGTAQTFTAAQTFSLATVMNGGATMNATTITTDTTTGLKIGGSTSQLLGFFGVTPLSQRAATTDLGVVLSSLGLRATGTAYTITTSGAVSFTGTTGTSTLTNSSSGSFTGSATAGVGGLSFTTTARAVASTLVVTSPYTSLCNATTASFTLTLPAASVKNGISFWFKKIDASANTITLQRAGTDTIDGATTFVLSTQYKYVEIISDGTATWYIKSSN